MFLVGFPRHFVHPSFTGQCRLRPLIVMELHMGAEAMALSLRISVRLRSKGEHPFSSSEWKKAGNHKAQKDTPFS